MDTHWIVWQLLDSAFPTGAFAHSGGVEAAWQQGWLTVPEDVRRMTIECARQAVRGAAPYVRAAMEGQDVRGLDMRLNTMISNHVANRASRQQGRALISTAERAFNVALPVDWRQGVAAGKDAGHLPVAFGVVMRALDIPYETAVRIYLFWVVRGVLSAAVRLGAVGPLEAQRLQAGLGKELEAMVSAAADLTVEDASQCAPLLDLWQSMQDRLYSRLFQS